MENNGLYDEVFRKSLMLGDDVEIRDLAYQSVEGWDSVGHMSLVAALEDAFQISFEMDDIIDFESYEVGKETLRRYGVSL